MKPTRTILNGDKEMAATYSGESKRLLFQLDNIQRSNSAINELTKRFEDGTIINVHRKVAGMDVVNITSSRSGGKRYTEWELIDETISESLVAIIPCVVDGDGEIAGMVCFDFSKDGWGEICDWTNDVSLDSKDPVAPLTEQETNRKEWYDKKTSYSYGSDTENTDVEFEIVRLQRCDGGCYAYDGDPQDYEMGWGNFSTCTDWNNNLSDEVNNTREIYESRIKETLTYDPGPWPGQDWTWFETDGGKYWGEEDLFYSAWVGGVPPATGELGDWWPPEFNQKIYYVNYFDRLGSCHVMTNYWGDDNLPGSYTFHRFRRKIREINDYRSFICFPADGHSEGVYGLIHNCKNYGNDSGFPYTSVTSILSMTDIADSNIIPMDYGIYIYNDYKYHIYMADSGGWEAYWNDWGIDERFPIKPGIVHDSLLTENQKEILKGNSDYSYDPPFTYLNYFTGQYETGFSEYSMSGGSLGFICEDRFYFTTNSGYKTETYMRSHSVYPDTDPFKTRDLGIFTKDNYEKPGDELDSKNLIYTYVMVKMVNFIYKTIIYGIIFGGDTGDREHVHKEFDVKKIDGTYGGVSVFPDFDGKSKDGKQLYGIDELTIGRKKMKTKTYRRFIIDE